MRKMIKYGFILILLSGFLLSCEKEISTEQEHSFIKFYGSYLMDQAGELEALANGGYAICGTETTESGGKRMVLIVTDEFGNVQSGFPKYYTEEGLETGGSSLIALQGGSGGYLLSGYIEKPVEGSQDVQKDIFVVRTTSNGSMTWQRSYGSYKDEEVHHSVEMLKSGYLLAGSRITDGKSDIMIMGVTEEGDSLRLGLNYNNPYAQNSTAAYLISGGDKYICVCTFDKVNSEGTGIQVLTFDDELSPLAKNLSGEFNEYGMCILEEGSGSYLVLGNRENSTGASELVLYGIETDGLLITNSRLNANIGSRGSDLIGEKIIKTSSGGLAIVGTAQSGTDSEVMLQFLSSSYVVGEQVLYGASGAQTGQDLELSDDDGLMVLGTNSAGGSSIISLMKTNERGEI